jgi:capsular polysaccharide biosynthesis protein
LLLDKTRKEYKKKVEADKTLLAVVVTQLLRNKKILKQANNRAQQKALCIANKIVESSKLDTAKEIDCPAVLIGICALPAT